MILTYKGEPNLISSFKDEFSNRFKNTNITAKFLPSPSVLITFFENEDYKLKISESVNDKITFNGAIQVIDGFDISKEDLQAKLNSALGEFNNNAGSFADVQKINAFVVGDIVGLQQIDFDAVFNSNECGWVSNLNLYVICTLDELDYRHKSCVDDMLLKLNDLSGRGRIFVMGRRMLDSKILDKNTTESTYIKIIVDLILNCDKIALPCGTYSAGYASYKDLIDAFWVQMLKAATVNILGNENNSVNVYDQIGGLIENGYENNFSFIDLKRVLRNNVTIRTGVENIAEGVKALYGNSLDIYLDNERKKIDAIIQNYSKLIEDTLSTADGEEIKRILQHVETKLQETSYSLVGGDGDGLSFGEIVDVEQYIFANYLSAEIVKLKQEYIKAILESIKKIAQKETVEFNRRESNFKAEKSDVDNYVANYINSTLPLAGAFTQLEITGRTRNYISTLLNDFNGKLTAGKLFEQYASQNAEEVTNWLCKKAKPYCLNAPFEIKENFYVVGNSGCVGSSLWSLGESYDEFDAVLNCTSINLISYREIIK